MWKWAIALGNSFGEFEEVNLDEEDKNSDNSLRILVKIDITKLLRMGLMVRIDSKAQRKLGSKSHTKGYPNSATDAGKQDV